MAAEKNTEVIRVAEALRVLKENLQCVICLETLQDPVTTRCGHTFCKACINRIVKGKGTPCPLCNSVVNRRGIVKNDKIRNVIQAVNIMISNAQKDVAELGYEDVLLPKDSKSCNQKSLPPNGSKRVNPPLTSAECKPPSKRNSKVESWLMGMHTPTSTEESVQSVQDDESTNRDSDCEMVSVSQIDPDQQTTLVPARNNCKPGGDGNSDEDHNKKRSNKKITKKSLTSKKAAPLNVKSKQQSLRGFMTPSTTSSHTSPNIANLDVAVKVPDPIFVLMDGGKENVSSILATRSPGWSRVQKMKEDFHQSKVLQSAKSKVNYSPVPSIEDPGSSDEQPCLNLSLESPVLRKKARMNEIVNSLASEIETIERSAHFSKKKTDKKILTPPQVFSNNVIQPTLEVISQETEFPPKRSSVRFLKLGSMVAKKIPNVPIYLRGSLQHLWRFDASKKPDRLLVDAETQTDPGTLVDTQEGASNVIKHMKSPSSMFASAHPRRSEGAYSECDMDAETVVFTQPVQPTGDRTQETHMPPPPPDMRLEQFDSEIIPSTFPEDIEQSQQPNHIVGTQDPAPSTEKICRIFDEGKEEQPHTPIIISSQAIERSPEKTIIVETTSHNVPDDELEDSCSSWFETSRLKHSRILHSLSDSSDSEVGVSMNQTKKRKTQVLSDNEDTNDPDISIIDTSKIMANIEAQLNDAERMQSCGWLDQDESKRTSPTKQVSSNVETLDEPIEILSDTSRTQIDSDGDSEVINNTPQKPSVFISRLTTESDDIVPSSQSPVATFVPPATLLQNPPFIPPTSDSNDHRKNELSPSKVDEGKPHEENTEHRDNCPKVLAAEVSEPDLFSNTVNAIPISKSPACAKLLFVCSSLPPSSVAQAEKLANLVGAGFSSKLTAETSHLIVRVDESNKADKTLKYLLAVAAGKWVVSFSWVLKCLEAQKLLPEEPYEVLDTSGEAGPRRSREAHLSGKKLFGGFEFCCVGEFPDISKDQMQTFLIDCGASVVSKPTDFSFQDNIIPVSLAQWDESKEAEYSSWLNEYSTVLVEHDWVLDCVGKFCVTSFSARLLCDVSEEYLTSMGIPAYLLEIVESE